MINKSFSEIFSVSALSNEMRLRQNDEVSFGFSKIKPIVLPETDSTNMVCRKLAAQNAKKVQESEQQQEYLVLADSQTSGRGRLGHSFFSPQGGLYMSLLLYPNLSAENAQLITTAAAVSVCRAIEKLDDSLIPTIKWVNDVYINGKKICGILTEGQVDFESGKMAFAVLGIGVNIFPPKCGWTPEIADRAGAIYESDSANKDLRVKLAALIVQEFYRIYPKLEISDIIDDYRKRMFLAGMEVTVIPTQKEPYNAVVLGIDDKLRLIVDIGGEVKHLSTGEVSIKLAGAAECLRR